MEINHRIYSMMQILSAMIVSLFLLNCNVSFAAHEHLEVTAPYAHLQLPIPLRHGSSTADSSTSDASPLAEAPLPSANLILTDPIIAAVYKPDFPNPNALTDMYKKYVDSEDIIMNARYSMKKYTDQLPGLKATSYVSLADILANVPTLKSHGIDIVGFDLEKAFSPASDMNNPVDVMRQASIAAHNHGLKFWALPGYPLHNDPAYASKIAPYCDIYDIQAQGQTAHPTKYYNLVVSIANAIKNVHASTKIIAQTSLNQGTVQNIEDDFAKVANHVNGLMVTYGSTENQVYLLNQILSWLKTNYGA